MKKRGRDGERWEERKEKKGNEWRGEERKQMRGEKREERREVEKTGAGGNSLCFSLSEITSCGTLCSVSALLAFFVLLSFSDSLLRAHERDI